MATLVMDTKVEKLALLNKDELNDHKRLKEHEEVVKLMNHIEGHQFNQKRIKRLLSVDTNYRVITKSKVAKVFTEDFLRLSCQD